MNCLVLVSVSSTFLLCLGLSSTGYSPLRMPLSCARDGFLELGQETKFGNTVRSLQLCARLSPGPAPISSNLAPSR
ncbi:hypothetical protein DFH08DRAFT_845424 [Mycena albidolilacea]|uniref:Secreted protein n=1 Tax=Mycena albidolilacea TaxID=1033008 RepID=A0AAD7AHU0_9AGAR|nr:hypothetical protein DFH08DRAFT_845424 [Mycena albidolilacea]